MKITNHYNIPESIVHAVSEQYPVNPETISVTDLIGPPRIRQLKIRHWEELSDDASNRLWLLLGKCVHEVLDRAGSDNSLTEEKLSAVFNGKKIVGKVDRYKDAEVQDWKITSTWSFILGDKPEWEAQLNVYAFLYRENGFPVNRLTINAILRDWSKSKSLQGGDYPPIPFQKVNIPVWDDTRLKDYLAERIRLHAQDDYICTGEDRWSKNDVFAVMRGGRKSAVKLFDDINAANRFCENAGHGHTVVTRLGEDVRCNSYCPVADFCTIRRLPDNGTKYIS